MHSNIIAVAFAVLISGSSALTMRNKHVADFRLFGKTGCHDDNFGVWTVIDDDIKHGKCNTLNAEAVQSIFATAVNDGCTLSLYHDARCRTGKTETKEGNCYNAAKGWRAFSMKC